MLISFDFSEFIVYIKISNIVFNYGLSGQGEYRGNMENRENKKN